VRDKQIGVLGSAADTGGSGCRAALSVRVVPCSP
jgi:hypothetical protein